MSQAAPPAGGFQEASPAAFASGTRAAGIVIALGYLLGVVAGPVVAVVGGLALITYGRSLLLMRIPAAIAGGAIAVIAGSLGVGALRWQALELVELRGAQAVLGPTLLVGPTQVAVAVGIAAAAALVALAMWLSEPWPTARAGYVWSALEAVLVALAIVTVFFDPSRSGFGGAGAGSFPAQLFRSAVAVVVTAGAAGAAAWVLSKQGDLWRAVPLVASGAAVLAGAALLMSAR